MIELRGSFHEGNNITDKIGRNFEDRVYDELQNIFSGQSGVIYSNCKVGSGNPDFVIPVQNSHRIVVGQNSLSLCTFDALYTR